MFNFIHTIFKKGLTFFVIWANILLFDKCQKQFNLRLFVSNLTMSQDKKSDSWSALGFAWELGYSIVLPLVIFAFCGRFLDKQFDTSPWLFLGGILFSIIVTSIVVYKKVVNILNKT